MRSGVKPHGFVLLLVLLVLVVAGSAAAAVASRSSRQVVRAGVASRTLQRKWAFRSIRAVCLQRAEKLLREASEETPEEPPRAIVRWGLVLGGVRFHLVLADEQAKADANLVAGRLGKEGLREALRSLQGHQRTVLAVRLRPDEEAASVTGPPGQPYTSFDQLLEFAGPADLVAAGEAEPRVTDSVTCWGMGKVHWRRASMRVLREALAGLLTSSDVYELCEARLESPDAPLEAALRQLELPEDRLAQVRQFLTDFSLSHSLWIVAEGRTRRWHRLYLQQSGGAGEGEWGFAWQP